jgi:peptidoglycan hydrolase-like protein with peptidoglycan-binding domain
MNISASVGTNGVNTAADVQTIQQMLNSVPPDEGGPDPVLKPDGISGPKTNGAIQKFQVQQFGWGMADGRVDPGGRTLRRLNEIVLQREDPQYAAILRAIDEVTKAAAKGTYSFANVSRFGFINPEVQRKLVSLQSLLSSYGHAKGKR